MRKPRPQVSLDIFKTLPKRVPAAAGSLGFALGAAIIGHGLLLALHPWRPTATKVETLTAADTTPELLRFSRRMPQQDVAATTIPLPPATTLPPPPPDVLAPLPAQGETTNAAAVKSAGVKGNKAQGTPTGAKASTSAKGASGKAASGQSSHPSAAATRAKATSSLALTAGKAGGTTIHGHGALPGKGALAQAKAKTPVQSKAKEAEENSTTPSGNGNSDAAALSVAAGAIRLPPSPPPEALQWLRDLRANQAASSSGSEGPLGPALKGADALPYLRLWDEAVPVPLAAGTDKAPSDAAQARRLPLAAARALGLDPGQQQWLKTKDQWLLVWIDGSTLWMLKSPVTPGKPAP